MKYSIVLLPDCGNFLDHTRYVKSCDYMALTGECDANSESMSLNCQESCQACQRQITVNKGQHFIKVKNVNVDFLSVM